MKFFVKLFLSSSAAENYFNTELPENDVVCAQTVVSVRPEVDTSAATDVNA